MTFAINVKFSGGKTVAARSFMTFMTYITTNNHFFQTADVTLQLSKQNVVVQIFTAKGTNSVWYSNSLIVFDDLLLTVTYGSLMAGTYVTFCIDKIFAVYEHYLNPGSQVGNFYS